MATNMWAPKKAFGFRRNHYDVRIERKSRKCLLTVFDKTRFKHEDLYLLLSQCLTVICKTCTWKEFAQMNVYL
jgi:hypothetical protein